MEEIVLKRIVALLLMLICLFSFTGCYGIRVEEGKLLEAGTVKSITVTTMPAGQYENTFRDTDANDIIKYLSSLKLIDDYQENPAECEGMTYLISLKYENGEVLTFYHVNNMFIKTDNSSWYKMNYEEAARFETLLNDLDNSR